MMRLHAQEQRKELWLNSIASLEEKDVIQSPYKDCLGN